MENGELKRGDKVKISMDYKKRKGVISAIMLYDKLFKEMYPNGWGYVAEIISKGVIVKGKEYIVVGTKEKKNWAGFGFLPEDLEKID